MTPDKLQCQGEIAETRIGVPLADPQSVPAFVICLAAFGLLSIILTMPWWYEGLVIPWDAKNHFYPMLRGLARDLQAGVWPLWSDATFSGRPTLADPQSMITSPSYLVMAALQSAPSMKLADIALLLDLVLGGAALMALGRMRGVHPLIGLFAALIFAFGGAPIARLQHVLLVQSYAWIPVVLLALEAAFRKPTLLRCVAAGVTAGLLVVGRDQVAFLALIGIAGWIVIRLSDLGWPWLRHAAPAMALAAFVAMAIALPPVLATIGFAAESNRPSFEYDMVAQVRVVWVFLMTLLVPDYLGPLFSSEGYWGPGAATWGPGLGVDRATGQIYAGLGVMVMLVWFGMFRGWFSERRTALAGLATLMAFTYALGSGTLAFWVMFQSVPGVDLFRRPADATFLLNLGLALMVLEVGRRYLSEGDHVRIPTGRVVLFAGLVVGVLALGYWVAGHHAAEVDVLPRLILSGVAIAALSATLIWGARGPSARRFAVVGVLVMATAIDLSVFAAGTHLNARPVEPYLVQEMPEDDPIAGYLVARLDEIQRAEGPVRVEILGLGGAWQNLTHVLGLENTLGYNPLRLARYDAATGARQNSHVGTRRFGPQMTGWSSPLSDLLGLRLIVLGAPMEEIDPASAAVFAPPVKVGRAFVYENHKAVPRVVLIRADRVRPNTPGQIAGLEPLPDLEWRSEALIGVAPSSDPIPAEEPSDAGAVRIETHSANMLRASIAPDVPGWLVFHVPAYPGWTASVDGEPRPLVPANGLFQAVAVRPDDREVTFQFDLLTSILASRGGGNR